MELEVRQRFERIEALLHAMAERENQIEIRSNQRMERAEQRMEKFDRRLEATRKLVEAGMKIVVGLGQRQKASESRMDSLSVKLEILSDSVVQLTKSQKAFLDSLRKGSNGSKRVA